jgi:hypothetical protein
MRGAPCPHPFASELPAEAIYVPPKLENFCWRIEHAQIREGGFATIHGASPCLLIPVKV